MAVRFETSPLFDETVKDTVSKNPKILALLKDFMATKSANPLAPYGNSDKSSASNGVFNMEVPKIRHAHLTHDISVWYTLSGKDPHVIRLYGIFTHDESGTGQPASNNKQRKLAKKMARQSFTS